MTGMGKPANGPLRRALVAAWIVFLSMAGTTIAFQVYHSVKVGQMPEPLAVLFGVVLLLISVCILEVIAEWRGSPWWVRAGAYLIIGGSMFMSAGATGEVVLHAAPPHMSLLFGFLLDAAALLAVHFILSGAPALSREAAQEEAARADAMDAERSAAAADRMARADAEAARDAAVSARENAERQLAEALARADAISQKLAAVSAPKARKQPAKSAQPRTRESAQGDDLTTELRALMELRADPELWKPRMGGELARRLGVSGPTGRRFHGRFVRDGKLTDPIGERSPDSPDTRSGERS